MGSRIRGEEQPGFFEILSTWLPHQPWFRAPRGRLSLTRVGGLRLPTPEGDADSRLFLELHIFEVAHPEGPERISVPVVLRSRPSALAGKSAFIGKLTSPEHGELWVYDGAGDRAFLAAWIEMARRGQGSRNGRSRGQAYADFDRSEPTTVGLRRTGVEPPRDGVSRTLVIPEGAEDGPAWDQRRVVDLVRRPEGEQDELLDALVTLSQAHCEVIPKVLGTITGAWEQKDDEEDPGYWVSGTLGVIREAGLAAPDAGTVIREALQAGEDFRSGGEQLGRAVGTFHADLAGSFGSHPQSAEQLRSMAGSAQTALAQQWEQAREEFDEDEAADLNEVIDLMRMQLRDADEPLMLQQIHGDLGVEHLRRTAEDKWLVREPQGLMSHALGLRDVVMVLMSSADAVMQVAAETPEILRAAAEQEEANANAGTASSAEADAPAEPVNFGLWYEEFTQAFLSGYRASDADSAGVDSVFFRAAMLAEALDLFRRWNGQWVFRPSMLLQVDN
ncbi:maltokinase N-terminal cap-like domain-containing protein [Nesterenkonia populi]|uniref:maltokinase N-terminal cap-like domain-containing protein n=1 Tax=Nesterenkonia populi TaxID=1591087 RepID=UPI0011BF3F6C|nr:hypothetical protein [Nesterenkonia populi]